MPSDQPSAQNDAPTPGPALDRHDDETEWRLLVRLEREGLLREGWTAWSVRKALDA